MCFGDAHFKSESSVHEDTPNRLMFIILSILASNLRMGLDGYSCRRVVFKERS